MTVINAGRSSIIHETSEMERSARSRGIFTRGSVAVNALNFDLSRSGASARIFLG